MKRSKIDVWVGLFVLAGAAAILFLALQAANLLTLSFQSTYQVTAKFDNIGGLKPKAAVRSGGVVVGRVESITFDDTAFQARVMLAIEEQYAFPKDLGRFGAGAAARLRHWPECEPRRSARALESNGLQIQ